MKRLVICTWRGGKGWWRTCKHNYIFLIQNRRLTMTTRSNIEHHDEDKLGKDVYDKELIDQSLSAIQRWNPTSAVALPVISYENFIQLWITCRNAMMISGIWSSVYQERKDQTCRIVLNLLGLIRSSDKPAKHDKNWFRTSVYHSSNTQCIISILQEKLWTE